MYVHIGACVLACLVSLCLPSMDVSGYLRIYLFSCLPVCLPTTRPSDLSVCLYACSPVCLSVCLCAWLCARVTKRSLPYTNGRKLPAILHRRRIHPGHDDRAPQKTLAPSGKDARSLQRRSERPLVTWLAHRSAVACDGASMTLNAFERLAASAHFPCCNSWGVCLMNTLSVGVSSTGLRCVVSGLLNIAPPNPP